jgi:translation initiation factor eIF-2B subunit beta
MPDSEVEDLSVSVEAFIRDLKQSNIQGSYQVAHNTLTLLRRLVEHGQWKTTAELKKMILDVGKQMIDAQPSETAIANMVRRVLKIIREECTRSVKGQPTETEQEDSLQKLLLAPDGATEVRENQDYPNLNASELAEVINELISELEASADHISAQALEHIHASEVILTAGQSRTVEAFLRKAAKKRKFQVIVVECAPFFHGHQLGLSLAKEGIETTVITDSAVFAMMSRVNKVIIGTHTVMANGGLKAISGSHAIALAAKYYSVPLIVCAALFKLSPQYLCSYDQESFNKFVSPQNVLPFNEGELLSKVQVYNPVFDYVPPELVTLLISNIGGNAPFYMYRLVSELYSTEDQEI